jgi:hypothetical protein
MKDGWRIVFKQCNAAAAHTIFLWRMKAIKN